MDYGLVAFFIFLLISLVVASERQRIQKKSVSDWATDLVSLLVHFLIIPTLQVVVVYSLMNWLAPQLKSSIILNIWQSALLYLALDYGWYWNHRILHSQTPLWNLHKTHHAPEHIDIFVTSRNALATHFLMVYFWFIGIATYVLADSTTFLAFVSFGMVINFWGHTSFSLPCNSWLNKLLFPIIVSPREHLWHHSRENPHCNFGTVFTFWDRLHGTLYCRSEHPKEYGESYKKTIWNQLIWPF